MIRGDPSIRQATRSEVMASQGSLAEEIGEALIQTCLETWRSRATPITPEEYIFQQWQPGGENPRRTAGSLVPDHNPKGCLFVPFDNSPPADQQLLEKRAALKRTIDEHGFAASELLLDREIMEHGYLTFEGLGNTSLAQLKTFEKRTEEEDAEWLESLIKEVSLTPQEQASWSYQFCKEFDGVSRVVEDEWHTVDTPEEFNAMLRAMEGSKLAPVFMRTCKLTEGRRISRLLSLKTSESTENTEMPQARH
ncbi:hypothetical protein DL766_004482 [Monosporascus sp. MC13-8B]|uniref:Uncharacterized protein n=1 Tax=Monosporascus cannonballus TaxID=155416 RepID=A0ABY0GZX6_9PEZI|nr:hypothetical protein DL762_007177 [Monosporascus cannonballus]RYO86141.1 hypothetical protein DL763_006834 [Monosporascus cannonballus]RYP31174.1 hypothetical protein DL766_004482 [Monosporascus sp. MC13-8B]